MLNFNSVLLFSENPQQLAGFYQQILGVSPMWQQDDYSSFQAGSGVITIGPHDKVHGQNPNPERILLNFETDDVQGEFNRIKSLQATVVKEPYNPGEQPGMQIATFADPDGNYIQLVSPMKPEQESAE